MTQPRWHGPTKRRTTPNQFCGYGNKFRAGETSSGDIKQAPVAAPYNSKVLLNLLPSYSFRDANVSRRVTYYNTLSDSDHAALRFTEYVQASFWERYPLLISLTQL